MRDNFQVSLAAALGLGSPGLNSVLDIVNPLLDVILTSGQVAVAVASVLYILAKRRAVRKSEEKDDE